MRRTKEEFVNLHYFEISGYILDAVSTQRSGAPLATWLGTIQKKLRERLERAYEDLATPAPTLKVEPGKDQQPRKVS